MAILPASILGAVGTSERKFVLVDFTHMNRMGCLRLYEAGHTYALPRAIAHATTKSPSGDFTTDYRVF